METDSGISRCRYDLAWLSEVAKLAWEAEFRSEADHHHRGNRVSEERALRLNMTDL